MIKDRVIELIGLKGVAKEIFFKKIGTTSANFRGKAKETPLNSTTIENILSEFSDISPEWLLTGKGEMLRKNSEKFSEENASPLCKPFVQSLQGKKQSLQESPKQYDPNDGGAHDFGEGYSDQDQIDDLTKYISILERRIAALKAVDKVAEEEPQAEIINMYKAMLEEKERRIEDLYQLVEAKDNIILAKNNIINMLRLELDSVVSDKPSQAQAG